LQIIKLKETETDSYFYSLMGKYFATKEYKKLCPYLSNENSNTWFIAIEDSQEDSQVVGFVAVNELKNKILLQHDFVEEEHKRKGVWTALNKKRLDYLKGTNKPLEIVLREQFLIDYWKGLGFEFTSQRGSYTYLRRGANEKD
jgi:predicted GNAT family acetyltransferase